jgi:hypothetical protein
MMLGSSELALFLKVLLLRSLLLKKDSFSCLLSGGTYVLPPLDSYGFSRTSLWKLTRLFSESSISFGVKLLLSGL